MKKIFTIAASTAMTIAFASSALAAGWTKDSKGWWYQNADGTWPASTWQWIDGNSDGTAECYYFNGNGYMLANTKTADGYTVNADGAWTIGGAVQTKAVAAQSAAASGSTGTKTSYSDPYSGTYVDAWGDGTVQTIVIAYNASDKTLTYTWTNDGKTYTEKYKYFGAGYNDYTCFELVSTEDKGSIFFPAEGVLLGSNDQFISRQ